jgi:hypothetical protein
MRPPDALLGVLADRAIEVGHTFNAQGIANTIWALGLLSTVSGDLGCSVRFIEVFNRLSVVFTKPGDLNDEVLRSLNQVLLSLEIEGALAQGLPPIGL